MAAGEYDRIPVGMPIGEGGQEKLAAEAAPLAIDMLAPQSDLHDRVLSFLKDKLDYSERSMSQFYSRWNANELKVQAYIDLGDYEKQLKQMSDTGRPAQPVSIVVPYSYATIWTIVTYFIHTFCGQKPIFRVDAYNSEFIQNTPYMETVLQFNADHTKIINRMVQWFLDAEIYGLGVLRTLWDEEWATRTQWRRMPPGGLLTPQMPAMDMRQRTRAKIFEGNNVSNVDPFCFFPDPRVPMTEVNRRGEFVFWRSFEGRHTLQRAQADGQLKWVDFIPDNLPTTARGDASGRSLRSKLAGGDAIPGDATLRDRRSRPFVQIDQGTVELVPDDFGFPGGDAPQKWLFSIANKAQIIQAEPLDYDHDKHPVSVIEPSSLGYAFGQPGTQDFLAHIQDTLSWFVNSHIYNVRASLNNMWVVDPSAIEMQDLKNPAPGKIIRLKRAAMGQDIRAYIQQLQVADVTANHMKSMEMFLAMGDTLSAVNDNLRGIQEQGGRKTATEVRTAGEAGASRLAARARLISAQGMVDLAQQMAINLQQRLSMNFYLEIVGQKGLFHDITPKMLAGDFTYPVSDGTLPSDKTALLGIWKEIWMAIAQHPLLSQQYDVGKIFEYIAELGGARNISQFKITAAPDARVGAGVAAGNLLPLGPQGQGANGGAAGGIAAALGGLGANAGGIQ